MRASLLHNGHLVGTGEASRWSLSQSPVLGRPGNKQRGAGGWGRGARERQAGARLSLIWLHAATQPCGTLCASQTNRLSLCSAAPFLSHRQASHTLTHTLIHTPHTLTHPHTNAPLHTPHSPSNTHTLSHTHRCTQTHSSLTLTYTHTSTEPTAA